MAAGHEFTQEFEDKKVEDEHSVQKVELSHYRQEEEHYRHCPEVLKNPIGHVSKHELFPDKNTNP